MRRWIATTGLAILSCGAAHATTCLPPPATTLADAYASAADIFVGRVQECVDGAEACQSLWVDHRYRVRVLEVIKDSSPRLPDTLELDGAGGMRCGVYLTAGSEFLIFVGEEGRLQPATVSLAGGLPTTKKARERRRILAEYKRGKVPDLSEAWYFSDYLLRCSLEHDVGDGALSFEYVYADPLRDTPISATTTYDEDGNASTTDLKTGSQSWHVDIDMSVELPASAAQPSPSVQPVPTEPQLQFHATLGDGHEIVADSAVIRVGSSEWPLTSWRVKLQHPGYAMFMSSERADESDANEILNAMRANPDESIEIEADVFSAPPPSQAVKYEPVLQTRATHLSDTVEEFLACVDGTQRESLPP